MDDNKSPLGRFQDALTDERGGELYPGAAELLAKLLTAHLPRAKDDGAFERLADDERAAVRALRQAIIDTRGEAFPLDDLSVFPGEFGLSWCDQRVMHELQVSVRDCRRGLPGVYVTARHTRVTPAQVVRGSRPMAQLGELLSDNGSVETVPESRKALVYPVYQGDPDSRCVAYRTLARFFVDEVYNANP